MRNRSLNYMLIAVLAVIGVRASSAQALMQVDKVHALQYLEATKKEVLDATKGLSEAQWKFKPAPDRWSVAQVMEHIAASEDFIRDGLIKEKVMVSPPGEPGRDIKKIDADVEATIPTVLTRRRRQILLCPITGLALRRARSNTFSRAAKLRNNISAQLPVCAITSWTGRLARWTAMSLSFSSPHTANDIRSKSTKSKQIPIFRRVRS